jgi:hypothetical protein
MKAFLTTAALLAALLTTACGESEEVAALRTSCEADSGMTPAECSCMIDKAQADLSEEQFAALTSMVGDGETPAESPMNLSPTDMAALMTFITSAEAECNS